ncbi:hypothetical protein ACLRGI_02505 [Paenarthrobacter nitroguajacolicus]|uniref:hypothetical protein n=1 Tax=Paenarthrobacter nitroguajacolicus TaxID=211146 RepID=UPI003AE63142
MAPDPRSLLFLSCDIVGSTQFKQNRSKNWQATFLAFYRQFPQVLGQMARHYPDLDFKLWKPVGDELIFTCRVEKEIDVYNAVRVWLAAMSEYESGTLFKENLATKGGAFIATFPGPDSESTIPINPSSEDSDEDPVELNRIALSGRRSPMRYLYDYFGPSIDTGFRIFGVCSQRHFTMTVEVAWAMSRCLQDTGMDKSSVHVDDFTLLTTQSLKGVWGGREYPVFAIDRQHDDLVNKALEQIKGRALQSNDIAVLCHECSQTDEWPSLLYLPQSGFELFKKVPKESVRPLEKIHRDGREDLALGLGGTESLEENPPRI